jgi:type III secretion protein Q
MLPFDLPRISRGHAELTSAAAALGRETAATVSAALGSLVGGDFRIAGRALPGCREGGGAGVHLSFDLPALPGTATLEIDAAFVAGLVGRMCGDTPVAAGAVSLTRIEVSALELLGLAAAEACARSAPVERALSPRLTRGWAEPASPLVVALDLEALGQAGRAWLLLPPAALRAFGGRPEMSAATEALELCASLRRGSTRVRPEDLTGLGPGDVLLLDADPAPAESMVLPGGYRLRGHLAGEVFHVEEMSMTEIAASIPITLEVELARIPVTLGQLARLEPGASLALPVDRRGLVTLRAGEQALAHGELVEIDGSVGVRIVSLEGRP